LLTIKSSKKQTLIVCNVTSSGILRVNIIHAQYFQTFAAMPVAWETHTNLM